MDIATILGIVGGMGLIVGAIGGSNLILFVSVPSAMIVMGGTVAAVLVNYPFKSVLGTLPIIKNAFFSKVKEAAGMIPTLVDFGQRARRDGILALQEVPGELDDPFLAKGIQLAVDGMEPQIIMKVLETEIEYIKERHKSGAEIVMAFGIFAPAFGMLGTLIGLVLMLQNMDDPSSIGPAMALALITTFYGALLANLVFIPLSGKLKKRSTDEVLVKELLVEGVISIASGDNPRIIEQKLHAFLVPKLRETTFK
ncbi:MAG: chemotaxis protein MotA [bacterium]|nr:MAG: chemotaxis protein MotA [bacterium]